MSRPQYAMDVPWEDAEFWEPGLWYPLPCGNMTDLVPVELWICEGWGIFIQEPDCPEDIISVGPSKALTFSQAVEICEAHNGKKFCIKTLAETAAQKKKTHQEQSAPALPGL